MLLLQSGKYVGVFCATEIRFLFDAFPELLGVRVDRLAGARAHMRGDLAPVLAVEAHGFQEPLVLIIGPIALSLSALVFNDVAIGGCG